MMIDALILVCVFITGFVVAASFDIRIHISKKEDYDKKIKEMDELMKTIVPHDESVVYPKDEMFPPDLPRDYGLPREVK